MRLTYTCCMAYAPTDIPFDAPDFLSKEARAEFRRVVRLMGDRANPADIALLTNYATTFAEVARLSQEVEREGFVVVTPQGAKVNPKEQLLTARRNQLATLCRDLTLTPKSRAEKGAVRSVRKRGIEGL